MRVYPWRLRGPIRLVKSPGLSYPHQDSGTAPEDLESDSSYHYWEALMITSHIGLSLGGGVISISMLACLPGY
jgi:hypothetical protein